MGRFYTSGGMAFQHLQVMYACVGGVMSVRVRGSAMHVGEGGVHNKIKNNHNFGLRTLLRHTLK